VTQLNISKGEAKFNAILSFIHIRNQGIFLCHMMYIAQYHPRRRLNQIAFHPSIYVLEGGASNQVQRIIGQNVFFKSDINSIRQFFYQTEF
jgi:hypothetical protein